ncbi:hypothetical protein HRG84_19240 [Flavisolibacter sp. BT320]|nr:hypothetical protein [Flavisolibacter longurius]
MSGTKCKIVEISSDVLVNAVIRKANDKELPSIQDGWGFNFGKRLKELRNAAAYVLTVEKEPGAIQGCLIYQLQDKTIPYMAYLEVAPHNKGKKRKYDYVAGCLIAFAYRQSLLADSPYDGYLVFDVQEEKDENQVKLMAVYSRKYGAQSISDTTMVIELDSGIKLIKDFLERE